MANFEKYAQHAHEFTKEIAKELGTDENEALRTTKSVFHTLRETITPEESMHLVSQLPMIMKAIYVDGWKISHSASKVRSLNQFLTEVNDIHKSIDNGQEIGNQDQIRKNVECVFRVLKNHIPDGELEHIKSQVPLEVKELIPV